MEDILSRTGASPQLFTSSFADRPEQHKTSLWVDEAFERERSEVFLAALELHKATVVAQSERFRKGLAALAAFLENSGISMEAGRAVDVYGFLAFFVPVISTTLASAPRMFEHVREGEIGWVFIDEASQATPYAAAGLLSRAKRAVVLGDPQQLMPVVMMPERITEFLRRRHPLVDARWSPNRTSLQTLADAQMPIGAEIASLTGEPVWTGMPLRTHRRCHSPMFDIANAISYAGQMVQMISKTNRNLFPVVDGKGVLLGIVRLDDIRNIMFRQELYHRFKVETFMVSPPARVLINDSMDIVMRKFDDTKAWNLPVVDEGGRYMGFISKSKIFNNYRQVLVEFSAE